MAQLVNAHASAKQNASLLRCNLEALQQLLLLGTPNVVDGSAKSVAAPSPCRPPPASELAELGASVTRLNATAEELRAKCADLEIRLARQAAEARARLTSAASLSAQAAAESASLRRESVSRALALAAAETSSLRSQRKSLETAAQIRAAHWLARRQSSLAEIADLEDRLMITNADLAEWRLRANSRRSAHTATVAEMRDAHARRMAAARQQLSEVEVEARCSGLPFNALKKRFEFAECVLKQRLHLYTERLSSLRYSLPRTAQRKPNPQQQQQLHNQSYFGNASSENSWNLDHQQQWDRRQQGAEQQTVASGSAKRRFVFTSWGL